MAGCKMALGSRNMTNKAVKMFRIQQQNEVTYNMTMVVVKNVNPAKIEYEYEITAFFPSAKKMG